MPNNIRVKKKLPELSTLYRYEEKDHEPTEAEKEAERQKLYHAHANNFYSKKDGGRLMTRKSMGELLEKIQAE